MRCFMYVVGLVCILSGQALSEAPWSEIKGTLKEYQAVAVHESEYSYGGSCIRLLATNVRGDQESEKLAAKLSDAQVAIPIFELHLQSFPEQHSDTLSFLNALPQLKLLNLGGASFDKKELARLKEMKSLETIYISGSDWDKEALVALGEVKTLKNMRLQYLKSDNWISFPAFPELVEIDLSSSDFDDDGALALVKSPKIQAIHAYDTKLRDNGLLNLADLKELKILGVNFSDDNDSILTRDGLSRFKEKRPDVQIRTDRPKTPHPAKAPNQFNPVRPGPQEQA
ncbi:MAG TPA: hypothetical protein PKA63_12205 [Oligoflexia bacterium]|nr:hypothetical protein [Oligoflexia bacterium]HMP49418.1 hypothetical protein [Oligoflexia bacterium]